MNHPRERITGILLAGGMSSRMGKEKGTLKVGDRMLFEYPLRVLESVCGEVLISGNKDLPVQVRYPRVPDEHGGIGPLGGLHACLRYASSDLYAVLPYDMPNITRDLLEYLIGEYPGWDMVVPALPGQLPEPLCSIFGNRILETVEGLIGKGIYAVHRLWKETRARVAEIHPGLPFYDPDLFLNINRAADLNHFSRKLKHG
jgi:molybdopterin-guanine dinucleotide biosynthesis protein A